MSWVLVFRIGSMGDSLVAIPAFRAIAAANLGSRIVLLTNSPVDGGIKAAAGHQVLMGSGLVHEFIEYPIGTANARSYLKVALQIRGFSPKSVYCLNPHPRSILQRLRDYLFFRLAGIKNVRGLRLLNREFPPRLIPEIGRYEPEPLRLLRSIDYDAVPLSQASLSLNLSQDEQATAKGRLKAAGITGPFIAISMGTKFPAKDWGQDHWLSLLQLLQERARGLSLVLIGAAVEYRRSAELARTWLTASANFCGQLSPRQSAAVLETASIFIGHDSGPMHLANAVGIPVISIFSSRDLPGVWFPLGNEAGVFYTDIDCRGCQLEVCVERQMKCIRSIEPKAVANRALALLSRSSGACAHLLTEQTRGIDQA